jgi:tRNA threonylcarbamoyl adenosine modification protein YeaZ
VSGPARASDGRRHAILALDTATTQAVIAVGSPDGEPWGASTWEAGYRHGDTLLPNIGRLLGEANLRRSRLRAIVVGTGPGAFTGLRVGIATAKGLAHALGIPIVGVATSEALLAAAGELTETAALALLLPAGPSDRVLCRSGAAPELLPGGTEPALAGGEILVAVDLRGRADEAAVERGESARRGLATQLVRLGAARLRAHPEGDDLARLVPEYVTLPRGVRAPTAESTVAVTAERG